MHQEINEDEVLSDSQSTSTTRRSSSASSDMPKVNFQSKSDGILKRQSSTVDVNDLPSSPNKQVNEQTPIKVLVFNGKCSKVFKSTLEDCVEDCILEFPNERNSIYVSKSGQVIQIPPGSNRNSIIQLKEQSNNARQSARSNRRRSSINQFNSLPQIGSGRTNLVNSFSLPTPALVAPTALRMRHQLVQQKFSHVEDISEETIEQQTNIDEPSPIGMPTEHERSSILFEEPISPLLNQNMTTISLPSFPHYAIPSSKTQMSYRDRQKDYRLSDLVYLGPETFAHVFNLPRRRSQSNQRNTKTTQKSTELDRIKQDLFHRYLWTQKPQVSCRIRPISTYIRSSTYVI